jgi:hypothetical protein
MTTYMTTYKGQTLTYELFYEVEDFVAEVDGVDYFDHDRMALVTRTAERLDSASTPQPPVRYFS